MRFICSSEVALPRFQNQAVHFHVYMYAFTPMLQSMPSPIVFNYENASATPSPSR
jgi:hypothetical protein